jgi:tRNA A37 threonylcarbamoyladenosine biosynthesis protein TsaE
MPYKSFYHIDCYRLKKLKDLLDLGFEEIISNSQNIVALEWAEKLKITSRRRPIKIKFKFINKNKRKISISF